MANYSLIFGICLLINAVVTLSTSERFKAYFSGSSDEPPVEHESIDASADVTAEEDPLLGTRPMSKAEAKATHAALLRRYLVVYLLAALSDWLQGPYVYALYAEYGYSQHDIAVLFVAGFGSSMVFGSFIGGMADSCGRRKFVFLFAAIYAASCLTKHYKNFHILMLGRLLGGVATSLLFSVFDSWLIRAHSDCGVSSYLSKSFSAASYGNSLIAIGAGLVANKAASASELLPLFGNDMTDGGMLYGGGYLNPFDISLIALVACGFLAATTWEENFGDDSSSSDSISSHGHDKHCKEKHWYDALRNAYIATVRSVDITLCGSIASLFEGSMYIFVFMWTPALKGLTPKDGDEEVSLPFGIIFSTFMVSCMAGSSLFSILVENYKIEVLGVVIMMISSISMLAIVFSSNDTVVFCCMNVFEACVGMYWPIMGTMKGGIVPEDKRAAIYNLFRVPLNFIVITSLLTDLTPTQSFVANHIMLAGAAVCMTILMKRRLQVTSIGDLKAKATVKDAETVQIEPGNRILVGRDARE